MRCASLPPSGGRALEPEAERRLEELAVGLSGIEVHTRNGRRSLQGSAPPDPRRSDSGARRTTTPKFTPPPNDMPKSVELRSPMMFVVSTHPPG